MAVGLTASDARLFPVAGLRLAAAHAGIRKPGRPDLVLFAMPQGTNCAAVFTRNVFCAAPVTVARHHLQQAAPRYLLVNSGNANAGTGEQGIADAEACCRAVAELAACRSEEVLPFSTGVIGEPLPVGRIGNALEGLVGNLRADAWDEAARGIMTTDTVPKGASRQIVLAGETVTVTGIAKGAGMIHPDMATMLAFIATDARVPPSVLQTCLTEVAASTFNAITVDGDTSTNDACVLMATGSVPAPIVRTAGAEFESLRNAVSEVSAELAQAIVRDAEGATKFITIEVSEGRDESECRQVALTIAHSPLVKTAFFASDPNWGRILAAVGRAGIDGLDLAGVNIFLGDVCVVRHGSRAGDYSEAQGAAVMRAEEIRIGVTLGRGTHRARIWTCDLSYDYVRINAEYRT